MSHSTIEEPKLESTHLVSKETFVAMSRKKTISAHHKDKASLMRMCKVHVYTQVGKKSVWGIPESICKTFRFSGTIMPEATGCGFTLKVI